MRTCLWNLRVSAGKGSHTEQVSACKVSHTEHTLHTGRKLSTIEKQLHNFLDHLRQYTPPPLSQTPLNLMTFLLGVWLLGIFLSFFLSLDLNYHLLCVTQNLAVFASWENIHTKQSQPLMMSKFIIFLITPNERGPAGALLWGLKCFHCFKERPRGLLLF